MVKVISIFKIVSRLVISILKIVSWLRNGWLVIWIVKVGWLRNGC